MNTLESCTNAFITSVSTRVTLTDELTALLVESCKSAFGHLFVAKAPTTQTLIQPVMLSTVSKTGGACPNSGYNLFTKEETARLKAATSKKTDVRKQVLDAWRAKTQPEKEVYNSRVKQMKMLQGPRVSPKRALNGWQMFLRHVKTTMEKDIKGKTKGNVMETAKPLWAALSPVEKEAWKQKGLTENNGAVGVSSAISQPMSGDEFLSQIGDELEDDGEVVDEEVVDVVDVDGEVV